MYQRGCSSISSHCVCVCVCFFSPSTSDHRVKEKDREKKKDKNKEEWKSHKLPPVHDIARENGEVVSPQKGRTDVTSWDQM